MDTNYISLPSYSPVAKFPSISDILSPTLPPQQLPVSHAPISAPNESSFSKAQVASVRRKKNADAQAAFRARRANYIASLEETVLSLEAVVISLQDSCRESRNDAEDLRQENNHLRSSIEFIQKGNKDRERQWCESWNAKLQALGFEDPDYLNDCPPLPPLNPDSNHSESYNLRTLNFTESDAFRFYASQRFHSSAAGHGITASHSSNSNPECVPTAPFSNTRTPCVGDAQHSHSSSASESPSSISFSSRFPLPGHEDRGIGLISTTHTPYASDSCSFITECGNSTSTTTTREPLSASEHYVRQRRSYSGPHIRENDYDTNGNVSPRESDQFHGEYSVSINKNISHNVIRPRRHTFTSIPSHSPSLFLPMQSNDFRERDIAVSNTLAVIKAQAFGSLRKTRRRVQKTSDSTSKASKVALGLLSARGIGSGSRTAIKPASAREKER